jgi:hypothetical protein
MGEVREMRVVFAGFSALYCLIVVCLVFWHGFRNVLIWLEEDPVRYLLFILFVGALFLIFDAGREDKR